MNGLIISCDSSTGEQVEQDEKAKLFQDEEVLMEKLKKQVKPAKWEGFEKKAIKKYKGNKQEIEEMIKDCTDALQAASGLKQGKKVSDEDNGLKFLRDGLEIVEGIDTLRKSC